MWGKAPGQDPTYNHAAAEGKFHIFAVYKALSHLSLLCGVDRAEIISPIFQTGPSMLRGREHLTEVTHQ